MQICHKKRIHNHGVSMIKHLVTCMMVGVNIVVVVMKVYKMGGNKECVQQGGGLVLVMLQGHHGFVVRWHHHDNQLWFV